jgi:hypothetical protein
VLTDGSRGNATALSMTSNPYGYPYTAKFVLARDPHTLIGDLTVYANPTHSLMNHLVTSLTGYQDAWKPGWTEPLTGRTARHAALNNTLGIDDPLKANELHSIDSQLFRDSLYSEGAAVLLRGGTHDYSKPFSMLVKYASNLRARGVPRVFEIYYRAGHAMPLARTPGNLELMNRVFDGDDSWPSSVSHFKTDPADPKNFLPIDPEHIPLVFELPRKVSNQQDYTTSVVGNPKAWVKLEIGRLIPGQSSQPPLFLADEFPLQPLAGGGFGIRDRALNLFGSLQAGVYRYRVSYAPSGNRNRYTVSLGIGDVAAPPSSAGAPMLPLFEIFEGTDGAQLGSHVETRTGGVSEDQKF